MSSVPLDSSLEEEKMLNSTSCLCHLTSCICRVAQVKLNKLYTVIYSFHLFFSHATATFFINLIQIGMYRSFGILFVEFLEEFKAPTSVTSLVMGMYSAAYSLTALFGLNFLLERFSIRFTCLLGGIFMSLGGILSYFAMNLEYLIFTQSILPGMGSALLYGPGMVIVGQYFDKRTALGQAISSCGVSIGGMCIPQIIRYLLTQYGLRGTMLIGGAIQMEILIFALLYRPAPIRPKEDQTEETILCSETPSGVKHGDSDSNVSENGAHATPNTIGGIIDTLSQSSVLKYASSCEINIVSTMSLNRNVVDIEDVTEEKASCCQRIKRSLDFSAFKRVNFWLIAFFNFFGVVAVTLFDSFLPAMVQEEGFTDMDAAMLITIYAAVDCVSRFASGLIVESGKIKAQNLLALFMCGTGLMCQFTSLYVSYDLLIMFVVLFGMFSGGFQAMNAVVMVEFLDIETFPKALGFVQVFHGVSLAIMNPVLGALRDITGTYYASFNLLGSTAIASSLFLLAEPLTRRWMDARKVKAKEEELKALNKVTGDEVI
ncbi:monocarboxylate transporter 5-like [Haliotis rubra]|uniref:monocarboxylate transporter 5-like n=1 Tax=Haliotis rubra TaxID=36100 RepID=UPI001EE53AF2|nr:monocarboxylate transporter 5-like [Haliotis rubra]